MDKKNIQTHLEESRAERKSRLSIASRLDMARAREVEKIMWLIR